MKHIKNLVIILIISLMLTSCSFTSFNTDTLLTSPLMSPSDQAIQKSISDAIGSSFELVYPKSGSYQTPIISVDITGNGSNESVCFYTTGNDGLVSFIILENQSGKWNAIGIKKSQATGVERVSFCDLNGDGTKEAVIGWQYLAGQENGIEIFSIGTDTEMKSEYTGLYNDFITFKESVVVISRNTTGETASASLIGKGDEKIEVLSTVSLNNSIAGFIKIQTGTVKRDSKSTYELIFIDEQLESHTYITELLILSKGAQKKLDVINLSGQTARTKAYTCTDVNGDKVMDIPIEKPLTTYVRKGSEERLSYVDWYSCASGELEYIKSAYTSVNEPFYIELPQEWLNNITIERNPESERIIHFYKLDGEQKTPMFSFRIFSWQEYSDEKQREGWIEIKSANENVYTYRSDNSELPEEFSTDAESIAERLTVLS